MLGQARPHQVGGGAQVSSSLLGPVDPSFGALSRRLKFTGRRPKLNEDAAVLRFLEEANKSGSGKLDRDEWAEALR